MTRVAGRFRTWSAVSRSGPVRSHEGGRVCAHAGCETVLSIYNPTKYCGVHARDAAEARRTRRTEPVVREMGCMRCGAVFETTTASRKYCSDRCRMAAFAARKREALRLGRQVVH